MCFVQSVHPRGSHLVIQVVSSCKKVSFVRQDSVLGYLKKHTINTEISVTQCLVNKAQAAQAHVVTGFGNLTL